MSTSQSSIAKGEDCDSNLQASIEIELNRWRDIKFYTMNDKDNAENDQTDQQTDPHATGISSSSLSQPHLSASLNKPSEFQQPHQQFSLGISLGSPTAQHVSPFQPFKRSKWLSNE
jgi:hypothetical protein